MHEIVVCVVVAHDRATDQRNRGSFERESHHTRKQSTTVRTQLLWGDTDNVSATVPLACDLHIALFSKLRCSLCIIIAASRGERRVYLRRAITKKHFCQENKFFSFASLRDYRYDYQFSLPKENGKWEMEYNI